MSEQPRGQRGDVPKHRKRRGAKPYRLEERVRADVWERHPWIRKLSFSSRKWGKSWRAYRTEKARSEAMRALNRTDRISEYRLPRTRP